MELNSAKTGEAHVLTPIADRIDAASAIQFKDAIRAATVDGPARIVLDLGHVKFVDSSGLGAIVASMKHMGASRKLALAGLTPTVEKVFRLTRMDSVFSVFSTLDGALDELKA